jgi:hypothetical protein
MQINPRLIQIAVAVAVIALLAALLAQPPRPTVVVTPIKPANATAAAPPQPPPAAQQQMQQQAVGGLFMCPGDAYKRGGVVICNPMQVTQMGVLIQRGWIHAMTPTANFTMWGDTSNCNFRISANTLYIDCLAPIMVAVR